MWKSKQQPNKLRSLLLRFVPTYRHFSGFGIFPASKPNPSPTTAAKTNQWAAPTATGECE
jgi:hypothetical protein